MTTDATGLERQRRRVRLKALLALIGVLLVLDVGYVRTHPLVFNESFFTHAHCMPQASGILLQYAFEHEGRFPAHTNGYGDALLLLVPANEPFAWSVLTGPGYDSEADRKWLDTGSDVPESECGRVYVQGLSTNSNPEIAILFDKLPSPGDHCHLLKRIWATPKRDVCFVSGGWKTITENEWPEFTKQQIEQLVKAGFVRAKAETLYAEKGKLR